PCPRLPVGDGPTIQAHPGDNLASLVYDAPAGYTVELADGTYAIDHTVQIRADGVAVRSVSGDPAQVILDGGYGVGEIFAVVADDVTIAELTLTHAQNHLVHVSPASPGKDTLRTRLYRLQLIDSGEQFVKINSDAGRDAYDDDGIVECSLFRMTDDGRPH